MDRDIKRLDLNTPDGTQLNMDELYKIAPSVFTESRDEKTGELKRVVNFDALRQLLGDNAVDESRETYEFRWVGKDAAKSEAARAIDKTLRPVVEDSVDWDTTKNLYIEGDNLEVLKLLQRSYMGKVKMIYIDPPYNTGNDFVYHDDFAMSSDKYDEASGAVDELGNKYVKNTETSGRFHSDWCNMIYPRLMVARSLLTEDGVIFISIDDKELDNLSKICNEVFGQANFVSNIIWQSRTSISNDDEVSTNHNYTLIFSKNRELLTFGGDDIDKNDYINPDNDPRGPWKLVPIDANHVGGDTSYPIRNPKTGVDFYPPNGRIWCYNKKTLSELMADGRIKFGLNDESSPKRKLFYNERIEKGDCKTPSSVLLDAGTTKSGTTEIMQLFDNIKIFDYPKPTALIYRLIKYGFVKNNDIVLDFFSGSATTAHSVYNYQIKDSVNCKFILVQIPENLDNSLLTASTDAKKTIKVAIDYLDKNHKPHTICEIGKERIRRAGKKIKKEHPEVADTLDTGFRVFRLDDSNFNPGVKASPSEYSQQQLDLFANNIKTDRTDLDLLFGSILAWGLQLDLPMETEEVDGCKIYTVNDGDLVACFAEKVTDKVIEAMTEKEPLRVLFRDSCFDSDDKKINIFETFKQKLDWTDDEAFNNIRVI